jgi:SAM-dependent methyltransferase
MRPQIADLLPLTHVKPGARILDLGCGPGTVSYARFPELRFFGVDQFAHPDVALWPANAWLVRADAQRLPWRDGSFEAAVCNFVFEHLGDPRAAVHELDRVLRPGALLYVSIPRSGSLEDRLYRFALKGGGHLQRFTLESFIGLIYRESGFKLEAVGPAPGAFTWLRAVPLAPLIRGLLFYALRFWRRATGNDALAASCYLLLFRLGKRRGFTQIGRVCSQCGISIEAVADDRASHWKCPICGFENVAAR